MMARNMPARVVRNVMPVSVPVVACTSKTSKRSAAVRVFGQQVTEKCEGERECQAQSWVVKHPPRHCRRSRYRSRR
jgi:hypothetical protein